MPLKERCTLGAYESNIRQLRVDGYELDQAVSLAADILRRSCNAENKPVPLRNLESIDE